MTDVPETLSLEPQQRTDAKPQMLPQPVLQPESTI